MSKSKVAIATDSTAYIPPDLVEKYNIHVIPQCLNWGTETYLDDVDIKPEEFYRRLKTADELPTTSQPSAGEFHEFFSKIAETSESIVGVFVSEQLSGTLDSAQTAVDMMPDFPIAIVDSRSASMGLGFVVLEAARLAEKGLDYEEIAEASRELVPKTHTIFVVDTLEFLHKGGRIGGASRLFGSMLSVKPVLHLEGGEIQPLARIRTKSKALERVLEIVAEESEGKGPMHASVIHASAPEEAAAFLNEVRNRFDPVELLTSELSPVVGTHTGPGLVGMGYYCEPKT